MTKILEIRILEILRINQTGLKYCDLIRKIPSGPSKTQALVAATLKEMVEKGTVKRGEGYGKGTAIYLLGDKDAEETREATPGQAEADCPQVVGPTTPDGAQPIGSSGTAPKPRKARSVRR